MACIRKRRHKWVVDGVDEAGKRRWITCDTRKEANKELAKLINGGKKPTDAKATVEQRAEEWLATEAKARLKASTYVEYRRAFHTHINPHLGERVFAKLSRPEVISFIQALKDRGLVRATIKSIVAPLRAMYFDAIANNEPVTNPAMKLKKYLPQQQDSKHSRARPLNGEELAHLLATVKDKTPYWYPMLLTAARTGMRLGELRALKWENVDLHSRLIIVSQAMSRNVLSTTKSGKSREVHMSQHLTDTLRALQLQRRKEAMAAGLSEIAEFVFLTHAGTQLDEANFRKDVFWRALSLAGLRRVRFHDFRHSFGSLLIEQGEDLNYVKEQLGHHSITLTVDVYGHRFRDDRRAVDALDQPPSGSKTVAAQAESASDDAQVVEMNGAPGGIRTPNPQIRSLMLCPVELRARVVDWNHCGPSVPIENRRSPVPYQRKIGAAMAGFPGR
jgi:integrase